MVSWNWATSVSLSVLKKKWEEKTTTVKVVSSVVEGAHVENTLYIELHSTGMCWVSCEFILHTWRTFTECHHFVHYLQPRQFRRGKNSKQLKSDSGEWFSKTVSFTMAVMTVRLRFQCASLVGFVVICIFKDSDQNLDVIPLLLKCNIMNHESHQNVLRTDFFFKSENKN